MRLNPNHVCDFLALDKTPDEYGEPQDDWAPVISGVFCEVSPVLGRDFIAAQTNAVSVEVKVRCRYIEGVKDEMRVQCGSDQYDIISAIDVGGTHRELLCYCRKVRD